MMSQMFRVLVYVGTYTHRPSQGIYVGEMDLVSGRIVLDGAVAAEHPSFLSVDTPRRRLYAVSEVSDFDRRRSGTVGAFALDAKTGWPTPINCKPSGGAGPCHLSVDSSGRFVLVANYGESSVAVLPLAPDGSLQEASDVVLHEGASVHPKRQAQPHAPGKGMCKPQQNTFAWIYLATGLSLLFFKRPLLLSSLSLPSLLKAEKF